MSLSILSAKSVKNFAGMDLASSMSDAAGAKGNFEIDRIENLISRTDFVF